MAQTKASRDRQEAAKQAAKAELLEEMREELEAEKRRAVEEALAAQAEELRSATASKVEDQVAPVKITEVDPGEPDAVTVHFLDDGLTVLGEVRYRGQELTVRPGTREWERLTDLDGVMILNYDQRTQYRKWGKNHFAPGLWPYDPYDLADPNLSDKDREKLRTIQEERDHRLSRRT